MSGPKDYAPPPKYSIHVFDGKLNEVFQLQSKLKQLIEELKNSNIEDSGLHIKFDCQEALKSIEKQVDDALKGLEFNYRGSFGQDTYNKILNEINTRSRELKSLNEKCGVIQEDFLIKEKDYNSYCMYHKHFERSKASFNSFKESVEAYLKNNTPKEADSIFTEVKTKLDLIDFELIKAPFEFGFNAKSEALTNDIVSEVFEKEKGINVARMDFNNQIIERYPSTKLKTKSKKLSKELEEISTKILKIIAAGVDHEVAVIYRAELDDLQQSESLKDLFYYQQLHDRILKSEKSKASKQKIQHFLIHLNKIDWHLKLEKDKSTLVNYCLDLINKPNVDSREVSRVMEKEKELILRNEELKREDDIAENERIFLKSQIVNSLENMGYEVMDDLEVIDFEKADDLLLKCKDKKNYLNLKFKEDGSIKYSFQIPESKESLTENELKYKLSQMDETCGDFQIVLSDLAKMGLKMELKSAKPTSEKWLLTITEKQKLKLKNQKRNTSNKKDAKKYLD
jgi:hypothetical protein